MCNDLNDKIFEFVYSAALGDAVNQKAFEGEKKFLFVEKPACNEIRSFIDKILKGEFDDQAAYDTEHHTLTTAVMTAFKKCIDSNKNTNNKNPVFTFGNAQKLINMCAKYVFTATYCNPELTEKFKYCHMPLDSYIIEDWICMWTKDVKKSVKWSKLEEGAYKNIQNLIRNRLKDKSISCLEAEFTVWEQAKERRSKKRVDKKNYTFIY